MTVRYGFFNSVNGDRKYDAKDFSEIFDSIIEDGVHKGLGEDLLVTAAGGSNIAIGTGRAWFSHTWTLNDTAIPMALDAAHASMNRIDAIVLEVDSSDAVRTNVFRYIKGVAASTAVRPTMVRGETLNQYALAYILRPLNNNTIVTANITNVVGTPETPFAVSRLMDRSTEPSVMHRNVYRGKYLGTSYTSAQQSAVQSGAFEDLYIGDYWTINGVNWRIVDMNYYLNTGWPIATTTNHLVVMSDTNLRLGKMNEDFYKANTGAYRGADVRVNHLPPMLAVVEAAFPAGRIMEYSDIFTSSVLGGRANNAVNAITKLELPTMQQMAGTSLFLPTGNGENTPPSFQTVNTMQFKLFHLNPAHIRVPGLSTDSSTGTQWLRDVLSNVAWSAISSGGGLTYAISNTVYGFRPFFCLK